MSEKFSRCPNLLLAQFVPLRRHWAEWLATQISDTENEGEEAASELARLQIGAEEIRSSWRRQEQGRLD